MRFNFFLTLMILISACIASSLADEGFKNSEVDLDVNFEDFFIMKKEEEGSGDLFYGNAFGTGEVAIKGPFDDIIILKPVLGFLNPATVPTESANGLFDLEGKNMFSSLNPVTSKCL